jgi:Cu/Ag efflux protein CusF
MIKTWCLLVLLLALFGCGTKEAEKRYPMQGVVKAVDPAAKMATIDAGKIDGWMDAMTMEYPVKPDSELAKLHAGDHIAATVVVNGGIYYVTDVKVAAE